MSIIEVQDNFTGGATIDPYRANRDEFELSKNVDIYYQPGRVRSYRDVEAYSTGQNDICRLWRGTDANLYGLSDGGGKLYDDTGAIWTSLTTVPPVTTGGLLSADDLCQMLFEHQGYMYWWSEDKIQNPVPGTNFYTITISRYNINTGVTDASWSEVLYATDDGAGNVISFDLPGPGYRHPLTDRAYFAIGNIVYYINKSTDPLITVTVGAVTVDRPNEGLRIPNEYNIVSLTYWETYLVILAQSKSGGTDKVYFWDQRNAQADFVKEIPEGQGNVIRNIGGQIVCVATQVDVDGLLLCYSYSGGEFTLKRSLIERNASGTVKFRDAAADVKNNTLFFGGIFNDKVGIWRFGLNKYNRYSLTIDRGATDAGDETDVLAIEVEGDTFTTVYNSEGNITKTEGTPSYDLTTGNVDSFDGTYLVTRRFYGGQKRFKKELLSLGVSTLNPFDETFTPSTQELDVYFRYDDTQTWTLMGTHDAAADEFSEFTFQNITEAAIRNLQPYYYIQFKFVFKGLVQLSEITVMHNDDPQINL